MKKPSLGVISTDNSWLKKSTLFKEFALYFVELQGHKSK